MSHATIAILPALAALQKSAARVNRHGDALRFRFPRTAVEQLPGVADLLAAGARVRVYTGASILTPGQDGQWVSAPARKLRGHTCVEVQGVAL